jgi:Putative addiction module component
MSVIDQIRGMPLHEKLLTMEALWEDLAGSEEDVEVPEWHKDVLDHRERLLAEGKAHFIDWEQAKKEIMDSIRC